MEQMDRNAALKLWRQVIVFLTLSLFLLLMVGTYLILVETEAIYPFEIAGFDVDSAGKLYISKWHYIDVYEENERLYRITLFHDPSASRYRGRIRNYLMIKDDLLYISSSKEKNVICYDLDGNFIATATDLEFQTVKDYSLQKRKVYGSDKYTITNVYGISEGELKPNILRYRIYKNNELLYHMRLIDYLFCDGWMILYCMIGAVFGYLGFKKKEFAEKNNVKEYKFSKEELFPKLYSLFQRITKKGKER